MNPETTKALGPLETLIFLIKGKNMLQELLDILNYEGNNYDIQECIEDLMETELSIEQEELIYSLSALAYDQGKREGE